MVCKQLKDGTNYLEFLKGSVHTAFFIFQSIFCLIFYALYRYNFVTVLSYPVLRNLKFTQGKTHLINPEKPPTNQPLKLPNWT